MKEQTINYLKNAVEIYHNYGYENDVEDNVHSEVLKLIELLEKDNG